MEKLKCCGCGKVKKADLMLWVGTIDKDGKEEYCCFKCDASGKVFVNC